MFTLFIIIIVALCACALIPYIIGALGFIVYAIVGYTILAIGHLIPILVKLLKKLYKFLKPKVQAHFKKLKEKYNNK